MSAASGAAVRRWDLGAIAIALAALALGGSPGAATPGIIALLLARELGAAAVPVVAAIVLVAAGAFLVRRNRRRRACGAPE